MRTKETISKIVECTTSITCDRCGKVITRDDIVEWQEQQCFDGCGGYGSAFPDSVRWTLDLCDSCWYCLVGEFVKYETYGQEDDEPEDE